MESLLVYLITAVIILVLIRILYKLVKSFLKTASVHLTKVLFLLNTVAVSGTASVLIVVLFNKDSEQYTATTFGWLIGLFIAFFIILQLVGNNVDFPAGWTVVRTIYNIVDGYLIGSLIYGLLKEKDLIDASMTLKVFSCLAITIFLFVGTYLDKTKKEREGV